MSARIIGTRGMECPYCNEQAALVKGDVIYPHRPDLASLFFWTCAPCKAYVGCHRKGDPVDGHTSDGTLPLGRLANEQLRAAKGRAHRAFDPLWKERMMSRQGAYAWLAEKLGIPVEDCHIGMFDVEQCNKTVNFAQLKRM